MIALQNLTDEQSRFRLYAILFFYAAMDGWRDAFIGADWLSRHAIKWISFYSLPIYVLWVNGYLKLRNWKTLLYLAAGGFFFWETLYQIFSN